MRKLLSGFMEYLQNQDEVQSWFSVLNVIMCSLFQPHMNINVISQNWVIRKINPALRTQHGSLQINRTVNRRRYFKNRFCFTERKMESSCYCLPTTCRSP